MTKNIKFNFAFLCDSAFFSEGGKLNIIGIFKNIHGRKLPLQHPQMFIVSNVSIKGSGNYEKEIKLIRKRDGVEIITPLKFNLVVREDKEAEFGVLGQLANIKFEEAGLYEVQILINSEIIKKLPLSIMVN